MGYYFIVCFLVNDNHSVWVCSEKKSEAHTEEVLYVHSVSCSIFLQGVKSNSGHYARKKLVPLKKKLTVSKLSNNLSLKNICLEFHATKIYFPPICYGFKNDAFGT